MICPNCGSENTEYLRTKENEEVDVYECEDCGEIFEDLYGEGED